MSDRERAKKLLEELPDDKVIYVLIYMEGLKDGASDDPFYSRENMDELKRRVANLKAGKSTLKEHDLIEAE